MAWLKEVCGSKEGIVPVQGIHEREIVLVLVDVLGQVGQVAGDDISQFPVGEEAGLSIGLLDRHVLEDVLDHVELGRESHDGVHSG